MEVYRRSPFVFPAFCDIMRPAKEDPRISSTGRSLRSTGYQEKGRCKGNNAMAWCCGDLGCGEARLPEELSNSTWLTLCGEMRARIVTVGYWVILCLAELISPE
jgi:hypothetical protein